jgi:hypothetical protein
MHKTMGHLASMKKTKTTFMHKAQVPSPILPSTKQPWADLLVAFYCSAL